MTEAKRERMGRVPADDRERAKEADPEATGIAPSPHWPAEAHEFAIEIARERTAELERIALTVPEAARRAKERRSE